MIAFLFTLYFLALFWVVMNINTYSKRPVITLVSLLVMVITEKFAAVFYPIIWEFVGLPT